MPSTVGYRNMNVRQRLAALLSVAALLLPAGAALSAAPAAAAEERVDLAVEFIGGTAPAGATTKIAQIRVSNHGTRIIKLAFVNFEILEHERFAGKVRVDGGGCERRPTDEEERHHCAIGTPDREGAFSTIPAGGNFEIPVFFTKLSGYDDSAATVPIRITGSTEGDIDPTNDTVTTTFRFDVGNGPDLRVDASNIGAPERTYPDYTPDPVRPGDGSTLNLEVANLGNRSSRGLRVTVDLPAGVTFKEAHDGTYDGCVRNAAAGGGTRMVCTWETLAVAPRKPASSDLYLRFPIGIARDLAAPVNLRGSVSVAPIGVLDAEPAARAASADLPKAAHYATAQQTDLDESDNTDTFAVVVAAREGDNGCGDRPAADCGRTDLSVDFRGTTLAAGTERKPIQIRITNHGRKTPHALEYRVRWSAANADKLAPGAFWSSCDWRAPRDVVCAVPPTELPGPGQTLTINLEAVQKPGGNGTYSVAVEVGIASVDDTDARNNTAKGKLVASGRSGPDLVVDASDLTNAIDYGQGGGRDILNPGLYPGEKARLEISVRNLGDRASGLRVMVDLPAGVTFAEIPKWCEQDPADPTSITCDNPYIQVVPSRDQWIMMDFEVVVAAGVDAPVTLPGGLVRVEPVATAKPAARSNSASGELPDGVRRLAAADLPGQGSAHLTATPQAPSKSDAGEPLEIDEVDNSDAFVAVVLSRDGSGGGGGGGDAGFLPVTGAQAQMIGGVGALVLLVGGLMFVAARRRKLVLVAPDDEKPAA